MIGRGHGMRPGRVFSETDEKAEFSFEKLKRIIKYFVPFRLLLLILFFTILFTEVLNIIPPLLTKNIIDIALPNKNIRLLVTLILTSFVTIMASNLIGVAQSYLNSLITENIVRNIRQEMYDHLQSLSIDFFENVESGEITSRMNNDIGGIERVFSNTFISVIRNIFIFVITATTLFVTNWKMALVSIAILPVFIIPTRKVGRRRWNIAKESQEELAKANNVINDTLNASGATLIKLFTKEKSKSEEFYEYNNNVAKLRTKENLVGRWFFMFISVFTTLGPLLIYLIGGILLIVDGTMTIGMIVMFVSLLGRLYGPITTFSNLHVDLTRSFALFDRIFEYIDTPSKVIEDEEAKDVQRIDGNIEFKNVDFSYNDPSNLTLKDINLNINKGEMVAFVGPSGAGKTTVTKLIPRLYDVTSGEITIDGRNIKDFTLKSLRQKISMVTQDTYLFNTTIKENLLFANEDTTDKQIEDACKAAYIHDFIMTLPDKYNTIVGERGVKLSGGEKQRVSIARSFLKDPSIVIFDEATSSLDSTSENFIQLAIEPLLKNKTSLVIAHRLSTILDADRIFVIDDGRIVESGTHEELVQQKGLYNELYELQFKINQ